MAKKISASDIFAEEDIFLGIRNSAEKTILTFQEIDAEVKKLGANLKKDLSGADFGNTKGINSFVTATQQATKAQKDAVAVTKVLAQAEKDQAAATKALIDIDIKKQKLVQEEIRTATQKAKIEQANANAIKKTAEASKVQMDSYKQLAASTRDLKNQSKELGAQLLASEKAGKIGTAAYAQLEQQFREVTIAAQAGDAELKQIDKTVGDNFRNVGNYEQATKGLKQQLREMTVALQNMESTDPRFKQMTIDAGELKDKIMDTNAVIKSTAGSAVENLGTGIAKAGKVGIDAFAGMTGAMGLFGIESEGAMQAMLKLQQLAAMSEALTSLGALGDTVTEVKAAFIAAATKMGLFTSAKVVDTTVTEVQTAATVGATVATKGLGNAMKALPIIAIIAGIAAIAYGIYEYVSASSEAETKEKARIKNLEELKVKQIEEQKARDSAITSIVGETAELGNLLYAVRASNAGSETRKNLINEINSKYGMTLSNLKDEEKFQRQVNLAIADYITYQRLRILTDYNSGKMTKAITDQQIANDKVKRLGISANLKEQFNLVSLGKLKASDIDYSNDMFFVGGKLTTQQKTTIKIFNEQVDVLTTSNAVLNESATATLELKAELEKNAIAIGQQNTQATASNTITKETITLNEDLKKSLEDLWQIQLEGTSTAETLLGMKKLAKDDELKLQRELSTDLINRDQQLKDALILNQIQFEKDIEALKQVKEVTVAETDVLDLQLKIKKAQGLELIALQVMLKDAELKVLNEQEQVELLNLGKNEAEKDKVRADYRLKRANLEEEFKDKSIQTETDITDETKASLEKRLKTQEEFIKMTTDFFIKNSEKKIAQMDKEIAKAESQYTLLQTLAANGNINAQESLAEQQRIINEANARKDKEMKRQQRIKLAESVYSTYNSKVAGGSEHPLMDTIKDTMLLQQFIASLPTFYDGTEDTGKNGNGIDGKGGFHAVLHPNERVIPKSLNEQIGGLSNEALAKMASEYQNGKIIRSNSQIGSAFDTAILVGKLDELTSAIKQKPETNIGIGEITQSVMEIVKSTKQGNTTTYNRYKVRR